MVNTSYDGESYDLTLTQHSIILDANNLYAGWLNAKRNSDWKAKVQMFEMDWLSQIARLQREIYNHEYKPSKPTEFYIRERGRERHIHGEQIKDRVVEHSLNDDVIIPTIRKYLIYDNGASLKGKGIDFTRRRIVKHLCSYYREYGNQGYVLLMDFHKYYDNIPHEQLLDIFYKYIDDETARYLLEKFINSFDKGVDIGNQTSQSAGILYPTPLDNYIKIVRGVKYYGRYMDDSYIFASDKKYLQELLKDIISYADGIGITINQKKTRIVPISGNWRFLQIQYSLTETGRIVKKINPKRVTVMRRKMKKLASRMTETEFKNWVFAWLKSEKKYLSHKQYSNILALYYKLKGGMRYGKNDVSGWN